MITDPYKVLNVSPNASDDEIKKAYRELARKYHPDHYHGTDLEHMAEEKMKEINEAYAMVQNSRKNGATQQQNYGGSTEDMGLTDSLEDQAIRCSRRYVSPLAKVIWRRQSRCSIRQTSEWQNGIS